MAKKVSKQQFKNELLKQVEGKLGSLLLAIEPQMGEKKMKKRIRRAGKILVRGIKDPAKKQVNPGATVANASS